MSIHHLRFKVGVARLFILPIAVLTQNKST